MKVYTHALTFQFKTAWTSSSFDAMSMIMNKNSQFTRIFSQAILEMKATGRWDILNIEKSRHKDQSCDIPDLKEKPLGYKKLAFLFVVMLSGILISFFVVLFEVIAKMYSEKQKSTATIEDHELNSLDDHIEEFLEALSVEGTRKLFQRIVQKRMRHSQDLIKGKNFHDLQ